jgi:hypothetical protein
MELMELNEKLRIIDRVVDWIGNGLNLANLYYQTYLCSKEVQSPMSKTYIVKLDPDPAIKVFQISDKNLLEVSLQVESESLLQNKGYQVELEFTTDGMLGFGTELIRQALDAKQNGVNRNLAFDPLSHSTTESYPYRGVYLTVDSPELIPLLNENLDFSDADKIQNKLKQEKASSSLEKIREQNEKRRSEQYELRGKMIEERKKEFKSENYLALYLQIEEEDKKERQNEHYLVSLYPDPEKPEEFEVAGKNLVTVRVRRVGDASMQGKALISKVYLTFTTDGMLEFGENLIRRAMSVKKQHADQNVAVKTVKPISSPFSSSDVGLYLTSDSLPLLVRIKDLGSVADVSDKLKRKKFIWVRDDNLNYVSDIIGKRIITCVDTKSKQKFMKSLGGRKSLFSRRLWILRYASKADGINKLQKLRDQDFMFNGGYRNPEAYDEFCYLRDKGRVKGTVMHISWQAQDKTTVMKQ